MYISREEAASVFDAKLATFDKWVREGVIHLEKTKIGNSVRYLKDEVISQARLMAGTDGGLHHLIREFVNDPYKKNFDATLPTIRKSLLNDGQKEIALGSVYHPAEKAKTNNLFQQFGVRVNSVKAQDFKYPVATIDAQTYWVDEGIDITQTDIGYSSKIAQLKTLGGLVPVTRQLISGTGLKALQMQIERHLLKVADIGLEKAFLVGNPANGEATGLTSIITQTVTDDPTALSSTAGIYDIVSTLEQNGFYKYSVILSPYARDLLLNDFKWDVNSPTGATIWGLPCMISNHLPAGDFIIGDFSTSEIIVSETSDLSLIDYNPKAGGAAFRLMMDVQNIHFEPNAFFKVTVQMN